METGLSGDPAAGGRDAGTPPSGARSLRWGEAPSSGKRERERLILKPTSCASEWGNSGLISWLAFDFINTSLSLKMNLL